MIKLISKYWLKKLWAYVAKKISKTKKEKKLTKGFFAGNIPISLLMINTYTGVDK